MVDSDTFVFEDTLRERVRKLNPSTPAAVGLWWMNRRPAVHHRASVPLDPNGHALAANTAQPAPEPCTAGTPVCQHENGEGNFEPNTPRGCCMCPVVQGAGSSGGWADAGGESEGATFAFNRSHGQTYYRPPLKFGYGGTGVLLSRGLLDSIPAQAWRLCARRLVCGTSDLRLSTCIYNLSPQPIKRHHIWIDQIRKTTEALFRATLNRPDPDARQNSVETNPHPNPLPRRLTPPRCPWSVHKLELHCVPQHGQGARPIAARLLCLLRARLMAMAGPALPHEWKHRPTGRPATGSGARASGLQRRADSAAFDHI